MLKLFNRCLNKKIFAKQYSQHQLPYFNNKPIFLWRTSNYCFSKKNQPKKKRTEAPKVQPKAITDYMPGPEQLKKNIIEIKNMQTTSQATLEEDGLKQVIVEQRTLLEQSLKQQLIVPAQSAEKQSLSSRIINKYLAQEELNKYYIKRPLKYLQNIYFSLFVVNALSLTWFQYINAYNSIGWFFGYFTTPAASAAIALLIGYNFSFWVVRQAFHLHIPITKIPKAKISLISTSWRNVAQLTLIASQFLALFYCISFGCPFAIYKLHLLLISSNFGLLALNLYEILRSAKISFRSYVTEYLRIVSLSTLLILIFALYQIQVIAGSKPEDIFQSETYQARVIAINQGYSEYLNFFKKKKYLMKENEKINPVDAD